MRCRLNKLGCGDPDGGGARDGGGDGYGDGAVDKHGGPGRPGLVGGGGGGIPLAVITVGGEGGRLVEGRLGGRAGRGVVQASLLCERIASGLTLQMVRWKLGRTMLFVPRIGQWRTQ